MRNQGRGQSCLREGRNVVGVQKIDEGRKMESERRTEGEELS